MMTALSLAVMLLIGAPAAKAQAANPAADKAAVHQAALDYVDAVYEVNASKIEKSVHPSLTKYGFMRGQDGQYGPPSAMTYQQLLGVVASWNKDGKRDLSIKKVEVLDVLDQTAVAKVTAQWGIDYMQLAKYNGQWKIINIIWQTHPVTR
jgi:hypothetical protein